MLPVSVNLPILSPSYEWNRLALTCVLCVWLILFNVLSSRLCQYVSVRHPFVTAEPFPRGPIPPHPGSENRGRGGLRGIRSLCFTSSRKYVVDMPLRENDAHAGIILTHLFLVRP